jgi:hypothetical protein
VSIRNRIERLERREPERDISILVAIPKPGETNAEATARAAAERGQPAESFSVVILVNFVSPGARPK